MSIAHLPNTRCLVDGCLARTATHLGVCAEHWTRLPEPLRRRWQSAWREDARTSAWTAARRECLEHLRNTGD